MEFSTLRFLITMIAVWIGVTVVVGHYTQSIFMAQLCAFIALMATIAITWKIDFGTWKFWE